MGLVGRLLHRVPPLLSILDSVGVSILALLVLKYLLYWHKSTNTDTCIRHLLRIRHRLRLGSASRSRVSLRILTPASEYEYSHLHPAPTDTCIRHLQCVSAPCQPWYDEGSNGRNLLVELPFGSSVVDADTSSAGGKSLPSSEDEVRSLLALLALLVQKDKYRHLRSKVNKCVKIYAAWQVSYLTVTVQTSKAE